MPCWPPGKPACRWKPRTSRPGRCPSFRPSPHRIPSPRRASSWEAPATLARSRSGASWRVHRRMSLPLAWCSGSCCTGSIPFQAKERIGSRPSWPMRDGRRSGASPGAWPDCWTGCWPPSLNTVRPRARWPQNCEACSAPCPGACGRPWAPPPCFSSPSEATGS